MPPPSPDMIARIKNPTTSRRADRAAIPPRIALASTPARSTMRMISIIESALSVTGRVLSALPHQAGRYAATCQRPSRCTF